MANLRGFTDAMRSHLMATGRFTDVRIGEPKDPPANFTAALMSDEADVPETTLSANVDRYAFVIRVYANMRDNEEQIELRLLDIYDETEAELFGEFDLGGTIRSIDATGYRGTWGYQSIGRTDGTGIMYRILDIRVPVIVDDSATFVA